MSSRRSLRQGLWDAAVVLSALILGFLFFVSDVGIATDLAAWLDVIPGAVAIIALWWRRRFPLAVGLLTGTIGAFSSTSGAAAVLGLYAAAAYCRARPAVAVAVLNCLSGLLFFTWRPSFLNDPTDAYSPLWLPLSFVMVVNAAVLAWGMVVRSRRALVDSLRERAERAEAEQRLLAEQARAAERTRIAREMHDIVAHRVSLVALHAGALQMRPDLSPEEVHRTAELIRTTARAALDELRGIVGVLRDPGEAGGAAPDAPQPTLVDLGRLVEESRRAGARVELTVDVADPASAPGPLGRDAYRIVQEGLTNVHKHAPGAAASVAVTGGPGRGLRVVVRNPLPVAAGRADLSGAGAGLLGLTERVTLAGGALRHGRTLAGDFEVTADLRWPA